MNKTVKKIAVTFVTALLIFGVSVNSFAYEVYDGWFFPTDEFPNSSTLLYGPNTLVIDINYNPDYPQYIYYRYQATNDSIYWVTENYSNGKYNYMLNICSNSPIYSYVVNRSSGYDGTVSTFTKGEAYGYKYWWYEPVSFSGVIPFDCFATKNYETPPNLSLGSGVSLVKSIIQVYPTASDIQNNANYDKISNQINEGFTALDDRLNQGFSSVNEAITNAAGEIINAGSDLPTLDTNNDWMNDSLTKVNEWVSSLDSFKQQMNEAKEENASNMQQAKIFINGFFDVLPKGIIAILTLGLVMIVVVKVIGR